MAHTTIIFKHPVLGEMKKAPVGFSWTTFFFGFFPALFRGDWKWSIIILLITLIAGGFTMGIGSVVCWIVFAAIYNKMYIKDLLMKGYVITGVQGAHTFEQLQMDLSIPLKMNES